MNIERDDVHYEIDNSEFTAPRGFPAFDKLQLDSARREEVAKLRVKLIDFNEEYLAKHPQVEALLRLILMEVLCHKPYDVRGFIKNLLSQDNLESRVAKIILSKRINLEQGHTEEYFEHVAEWETKHNEDDSPVVNPSEWPEPRPFREEKERDKKEYCHLHYYKEPYFLYPTEMTKCKHNGNEKIKPKLKKMPSWKSKFLMKEFFSKWGNSLGDIDSDTNSKVKTNPEEKEEKKGWNKKNGDTDQRKYKEKNVKNDSDVGSESEGNRRKLLKCQTCRRAVLGIHKSIDNIDIVRRSVGKSSTLSSKSKKNKHSVKTSHILSEKVEDIEKEWMNANKTQVYTRSLQDDKHLYNEKFERLAKVSARVSGTKWQGSQFVDYIPSWTFKERNDEINFTLPLTKLDKCNFREGAYKNNLTFKTDLKGKKVRPDLESNKKGGKEKLIKIWKLPKQYRKPKYQVIINPTEVKHSEDVKVRAHVPVVNLDGEVLRSSSVTICSDEISDTCISNQEEIENSQVRVNKEVPVVNLDGEIIKSATVYIKGDEITDASKSQLLVTEGKTVRLKVNGTHGEILIPSEDLEKGETNVSPASPPKVVSILKSYDSDDVGEIAKKIKIAVKNLEGNVVRTTVVDIKNAETIAQKLKTIKTEKELRKQLRLEEFISNEGETDNHEEEVKNRPIVTANKFKVKDSEDSSFEDDSFILQRECTISDMESGESDDDALIETGRIDYAEAKKYKLLSNSSSLSEFWRDSSTSTEHSYNGKH